VHFIRDFISKFSRQEVKLYLWWLKDVFLAPDLARAQKRKKELVPKLERPGKERVGTWGDENLELCFDVYSLTIKRVDRQRYRSEPTQTHRVCAGLRGASSPVASQ